MDLKKYTRILKIFGIRYDMFVHRKELLIIRYKVPFMKRYRVRAFNSKGEQVYREKVVKK